MSKEKLENETVRIKHIPENIKVGVYYRIDEETKKVVFDVDSMHEEFMLRLEELEKLAD